MNSSLLKACLPYKYMKIIKVPEIGIFEEIPNSYDSCHSCDVYISGSMCPLLERYLCHDRSTYKRVYKLPSSKYKFYKKIH